MALFGDKGSPGVGDHLVETLEVEDSGLLIEILEAVVTLVGETASQVVDVPGVKGSVVGTNLSKLMDDEAALLGIVVDVREGRECLAGPQLLDKALEVVEGSSGTRSDEGFEAVESVSDWIPVAKGMGWDGVGEPSIQRDETLLGHTTPNPPEEGEGESDRGEEAGSSVHAEFVVSEDLLGNEEEDLVERDSGVREDQSPASELVSVGPDADDQDVLQVVAEGISSHLSLDHKGEVTTVVEVGESAEPGDKISVLLQRCQSSSGGAQSEETSGGSRRLWKLFEHNGDLTVFGVDGVDLKLAEGEVVRDHVEVRDARELVGRGDIAVGLNVGEEREVAGKFRVVEFHRTTESVGKSSGGEVLVVQDVSIGAEQLVRGVDAAVRNSQGPHLEIDVVGRSVAVELVDQGVDAIDIDLTAGSDGALES